MMMVMTMTRMITMVVHDRGMVIEMVMMITGVTDGTDGDRDDHSGDGERDDDAHGADSDG